MNEHFQPAAVLLLQEQMFIHVAGIRLSLLAVLRVRVTTVLACVTISSSFVNLAKKWLKYVYLHKPSNYMSNLTCFLMCKAQWHCTLKVEKLLSVAL